MSERFLICVVKDGEYKVAQYGEWANPEEQGLRILTFLKENISRELFEKKVLELTFVTDEEFSNMRAEAELSLVGTSIDVSARFEQLFPQSSKSTCSDILLLIQQSEMPLKLINRIAFAADSLFCEWAYVIDLDKNTFEVYEGLNEKPLKKEERFYFLQNPDSEYYPVKHVVSFDINKLPTNEEFSAIFDED